MDGELVRGVTTRCRVPVFVSLVCQRVCVCVWLCVLFVSNFTSVRRVPPIVVGCEHEAETLCISVQRSLR